jgi:hypothetical protein
MLFMSDNCLFDPAAGDAITGARYAGRDAVRQMLAGVSAAYSDARRSNARQPAFEDRWV